MLRGCKHKIFIFQTGKRKMQLAFLFAITISVVFLVSERVQNAAIFTTTEAGLFLEEAILSPEANTRSNIPKIKATPCEKIIGNFFLQHNNHTLQNSEEVAGEINRLRRHLGIDYPDCYETHLPLFLDLFRQRLHTVKRLFNLHIPKAGGTSFCDMAKNSANWSVVTNSDNCWDREWGYPVWWAPGKAEQLAKNKKKRFSNGDCAIFEDNLPRFIMNENYLDYPLCMNYQLYSIVLRDPVTRSKSQENHFLKEHRRSRKNLIRKVKEWKEAGHDMDFRAVMQKHLSLARNNYVTWSFTAGLDNYSHVSSPLDATPQLLDLPNAKDTLAKFDFILEWSYDPICEANVLKLMGFQERVMRHSLKSSGYDLIRLKEEEYETLNRLDLELFRYARQLMEVDCQFFARLVEEYEHEQ
mmetsp:Transcript_11886/g.18234  ORF Transcript_11886/g.18234 Transcript_11886/m.18234 type:complete len:412 (+) Transcript_11886:61-1296(+)